MANFLLFLSKNDLLSLETSYHVTITERASSKEKLLQ